MTNKEFIKAKQMSNFAKNKGVDVDLKSTPTKPIDKPFWGDKK